MRLSKYEGRVFVRTLYQGKELVFDALGYL